MPTEWLRVMLEEVARKRREEAEARADSALREHTAADPNTPKTLTRPPSD